MFQQTFVTARGDARKPWPMAASLALQTAFVTAVLLVPLFQTVTLALKPAPPLVFIPLKPKVVEAVQRQIASTQAVNLRPAFRPSFVAPSRIPTRIATEDGPAPMAFLPQGTGTAVSDPLAGMDAAPATVSIAPQPVATAPKAAVSRVRVGGGVQAAKLIRQVKPAYPQLARAARMSGTVRLQAIIGVDGRIRNLQLLGGPPLLVAAALDAVKQWQYEPTLLNGEPVEVITSIEVNFTLNQ